MYIERTFQLMKRLNAQPGLPQSVKRKLGDWPVSSTHAMRWRTSVQYGGATV